MKQLQDWVNDTPPGCKRSIGIRCITGLWTVMLDQFGDEPRNGFGMSAEGPERAWAEAKETFG